MLPYSFDDDRHVGAIALHFPEQRGHHFLLRNDTDGAHDFPGFPAAFVGIAFEHVADVDEADDVIDAFVVTGYASIVR